MKKNGLKTKKKLISYAIDILKRHAQNKESKCPRFYTVKNSINHFNVGNF